MSAGRRSLKCILVACLFLLTACDGGDPRPDAMSGVSTTPSGVSTTPSGVSTTPSGVSTTPSDVSTTPSDVSTTPLPLQGSGLAVGGDVQDRATDIAELGLTKEQLESILDKCKGVIVFGPSSADEDCLHAPGMQEAPPVRCMPYCLRIRIYATADQQMLGQQGYVEVTDEQPGKPLCGSEAAGVCMRVGASSLAALDRVLEEVRPRATTPPSGTSTMPTTSPDVETTTPTETRAPTESSSPAETTPASPPPTSSDDTEDSSSISTSGTS